VLVRLLFAFFLQIKAKNDVDSAEPDDLRQQPEREAQEEGAERVAVFFVCSAWEDPRHYRSQNNQK
jgi:hypothetical protein